LGQHLPSVGEGAWSLPQTLAELAVDDRGRDMPQAQMTAKVCCRLNRLPPKELRSTRLSPVKKGQTALDTIAVFT